MTSPANAVDTGSFRWYIHPVTGERFLSVTAALSHIAKFELPQWAATLSAKAAIDAWSRVREAAAIDPCERRGEDECGQCRDCVTRWLANRHAVVRDTAADLGSRFHQAIENQTKIGPDCYVDPDVRPFLDSYNEWADLAQPVFRWSETTVINRKYGYAGTLDAINFFSVKSELPASMRHLKRRTVLVDYKTGKSVGRPNAWQLNAYRGAEAILQPDGTELPMPGIGTGLILHVRPKAEGGTKMREAFLTSQNFRRFVNVLRLAESMMSPLGESLSRPAYFKTPKGA